MQEKTSNVALACAVCERSIRRTLNPAEGWVHNKFDYEVATTDRLHYATPDEDSPETLKFLDV